MDVKPKPDGKMSHLVIERLADLADGEPTANEREHLAECVMCSTELEAYQRVLGLAADERRRIAPPLTDWGTLGARARAEGLVTAPIQAMPRQGSRIIGMMSRIAAAAVLVLGGTVVGRLSAGLPAAEALAVTGFRPASTDSVPSAGDEFASPSAALTALESAQHAYERAALYLASHDTSTFEGSPDVYRSQLAALDVMAEASLQALQEAPADPVMNLAYRSALGWRERTLSKLGTALPVGTRLTRF
jgi:hypothetical protein